MIKRTKRFVTVSIEHRSFSSSLASGIITRSWGSAGKAMIDVIRILL